MSDGQYSVNVEGMGRVFIDGGGSVYEIQVNGKRFRFEWHFYCGPTALTKHGDPLANQPIDFLEAATFWNLQGRRIENGLCVWDRVTEPQMITNHLGGRNYEVVGWTPEQRTKGE